ncbi:MAG: hypothetical protein IPK04_11360 [Bdellovibrionales bacterium]|nr:hypothetical protein [Bdellovibrionales bacterium]
MFEDLGAFNDEILGKSHRRPPDSDHSAVGHEIDFTISDFVRDLRASATLLRCG